jgi:hypothetical protein
MVGERMRDVNEVFEGAFRVHRRGGLFSFQPHTSSHAPTPASMKVTRLKRIRKQLKYFLLNFNLRPPYRILRTLSKAISLPRATAPAICFAPKH